MNEAHSGVVRDFLAEADELGSLLAHVDSRSWDTRTPAPGWTIRDQVAHLLMFDERCRWSIAEPTTFVADRAALAVDGRYSRVHDGYAELGPGQLLGLWRRGVDELVVAARQCDPRARCQWYGPSMSATSMVTARLMETWAHGQDVVDALGRSRRPTARLRHVAHIAVGARRFAYAAHGLAAPENGVRVELAAPDGSTWTWGEPGPDTVRGDALGFCLAATQRRHPDDCGLEVEGSNALEWVSIIQAFAGPPGEGRRPGQFGPL